jgi:Tfp pilus assembly protein PilF
MPRFRPKTIAIGSIVAIAAIAVFGWAGPWLSAEFCRYRGTAALQRHREELALEWFQLAEQYEPANGATQFLLARTSRHLNRFDQVEHYLERAVHLGFSRDRAEREQWLALAQFGKTDQLGSRLDQLLDRPGEDEREILSALANGYTNSLDLDAANAVLTEWRNRFPEDSESFACAGQFHQSLGEWPKALEFYRKSLRLDSENTTVRLNLAQCLANSHEPAAAEPEFRRVLRDQPNRVEAWLGLGMCLVDLGRADDARKALTEALGLDPHNFEVARALGELELSQGQIDAAVKILSLLADRWPHDIAVCTLMARAMRESGDPDRALAYSEEADRSREVIKKIESLIDRIKHERGDAASRYQAGILLLDYQSREQGVGWLQSVLLYEPGHEAAHAALARYYDRIGNSKLADLHRQQSGSQQEDGHVP